jgi:hypothetical protein
VKALFRVLVVIAGFVVLLVACSQNGDSETDWESLFTAINRNQTYNNTISSFGTQLFKFTTAGAGDYTISVTSISVGGDMGWELYDDPDPNVAVYVGGSDVNFDNGDEIDTVTLLGSRKYYLVIDEWADPGSSVNYSLLVTP